MEIIELISQFNRNGPLRTVSWMGTKHEVPVQRVSEGLHHCYKFTLLSQKFHIRTVTKKNNEQKDHIPDSFFDFDGVIVGLFRLGPR